MGAEPQTGGGVHFRVWAPEAGTVHVVIDGRRTPLDPDGDGYQAGLVREAGPGTRYRFRLGPEADVYPDPASRFQPEGPHGPSEVVDPGAFRWTDGGWRGIAMRGQVLYEMHLGTFTPEGTWAAARERLPRLADLGVTAVEVMPVAESAGSRGWGYDGVDLFAPSHWYGRPDDFRAFVDCAHGLGLGVLLDVVYNHFGPDGNYMKVFSPRYFSSRHMTDWGEGIDYGTVPVREFFLANAGYWIREFHLDGLRLDSTQDIHDDSPEHILAAIGRRAREAAGGRSVILIAENEPQDSRIVRPLEQGGYGLDGLWNDDFHHAARVALTGSREAYYADYRGTPQEFISALKHGYLFQGQFCRWQDKRRGVASLDAPPPAFVTYLENHDQVANTARGERLVSVASPACLRALTAVMLLGPGTPMLFQGQEWGSRKPFLYFTGHAGDLAAMVKQGRAAFLGQFANVRDPAMRALLADPGAGETFERSKLDESARDPAMEALHRDLLRIRRTHAAFRRQERGGVDGAVLGDQAWVARFFGENGDDRLLLVNTGVERFLPSVPEPLLAPPAGRTWTLVWSSESPAYGGSGVAPMDLGASLRLPGQCAMVMGP